MTIEMFEDIFGKDSDMGMMGDGDNALNGLNIIKKYMPKKGIEGVDHDIIYSVGVEELIEAGITIEDTEKLSKLNWMIQDDYLACYV